MKNKDLTVISKLLVNVTPVVVTAVTINLNSVNFLVGTSDSLKATVSPSNATNKTLVWSSSNSGIASITSGGYFTAVALGPATITAATPDGKVVATAKVQVADISAFVVANVVYTLDTLNNAPVEKVYFKFANNSLYQIDILEWYLAADSGDIGLESYGEGVSLDVLLRGENYTSTEQTFSINQYAPGQTTLQNWPVIVPFTCLGRAYQLTLNMQGNTIVKL